MKILQQKNKIRIGIALILSVITLAAVYGFGWALSAEQNVLLALSGLPENQKWLINGDFSLILKQLDSPIIFNFSGDLDYGGGKLDSRWQLENETFGRVNLLNLAHDQSGWLVELPALLEGQLWHLSDGQNKLTQEKVMEWIKELQFQKAGYQSLEREYGGSISCLHLVSSANILPNHFIEWLSKVSDQDLSPERRKELQTLIQDNLMLVVECYLTPDLKLMELELIVSLKDQTSAELRLKARPQRGEEPELTYYQNKEKVEVDADMLESLLNEIESWNQGAEE